MIPLSKNHIILYSSLLLSAVCYYFISYHTPRHEYIQLFSLVGVLFACFAVTYRYAKEITSLRFWFNTAIIFRLLFLFSTPALSDDYHRFVWDGHLQTEGVNPYKHQPVAAILQLPFDSYEFKLLTDMNSPEYYSVYPPVLQVLFVSAAYTSGHNIDVNVMLLKLFLLIFEAISLWLIYRLLLFFKLPPERWLLYALNPLVIIEIVGNIHFEGVMITGLLATVYFFSQKKHHLAAVSLTIAIGAKLLPLMLLPMIWYHLGWKKGFIFCSLVGFGMIAMFLPYVDFELISNFGQSLDLYFQKFEYNGSVYYILRWLGILYSGHNIISTIGIITGLATFAGILLVSFRKGNTYENIAQKVVFIFGIYLLFSTVLHPWYTVPILMISIFTKYRFTILWSGLIFLTYFTYKDATYTENLWIVALEYVLVIGYFIYEWRLNGSYAKKKIA